MTDTYGVGEAEALYDAIERGEAPDFELDSVDLHALSGFDVGLYVEMEIGLPELADLCEMAPEGRVTGSVEYGELVPEELVWSESESIPLLAGRLTGPTELVARVAACRAQITSPEEDVLWNQCYRIAAELLASLDEWERDIEPRLHSGVYRTVDGDVLHVWVECEYEGETYICETHTHKPHPATDDRGGIRVVDKRPDEYVPTDGPYTPAEIAAGDCFTDDPRLEKIPSIFASAVDSRS